MPTAAATWADPLTRVHLARVNHQPAGPAGKYDVDRERGEQRSTAPAEPLDWDLSLLPMAQLDPLIHAAIHLANLRRSLTNYADSKQLLSVPERYLRVP